MWDWGIYFVSLLSNTFAKINNWGDGHFSVLFLVLFLFFLVKFVFIMFGAFFHCFGGDVLGTLCGIGAFTLCRCCRLRLLKLLTGGWAFFCVVLCFIFIFLVKFVFVIVVVFFRCFDGWLAD